MDLLVCKISEDSERSLSQLTWVQVDVFLVCLSETQKYSVYNDIKLQKQHILRFEKCGKWLEEELCV